MPKLKDINQPHTLFRLPVVPGVTFDPAKKPDDYVPPRDLPMRPGATDAFNLPSIHNGREVQRKPPAAMCVGIQKEFANKGRD